MSSIGSVAKSWLMDPPWQKVFKHTFDVIEDYISYALITGGTIFLSVRLLSTLGTGDLNCVILGVENGTLGGINPYPSGGTSGLLSYASNDEECIRTIYSKFMEYMPYILLIQTLILVIVEKFSFKIPRIAQKVERFYINIVEESLFGKDPDVSEDLTDPKTSTEVISRRRQRNEICVSLKKSKIIGRVYVAKNVCEILLDIAFLSVNIVYLLNTNDDLPRTCSVLFKGVDDINGPVETDHHIFFQCRGKKMKFFIIGIYIQVVLLALHGICSLGAIIWSLGFRSVSNLLRKISEDDFKIKKKKRYRGGSNDFYGYRNGNDFLFLFDLLAHTCGIESTLRVLTHSDENFYETCRPKIDTTTDLTLEEDKLKIVWRPADIEKLFRRNSVINIESYEVTIYPAETVQNTCTIPANTYDSETNDDVFYSIWFYDLSGGRTEYVVTIACMVGKSRMKGEKVVTNLSPYGPEMPRSGMIKNVSTDQAEIFWDPPKGEFTKYTLALERIDKEKHEDVDTGATLSKSSIPPLPGQMLNENISGQLTLQKSARKIENLSFKLTSYTILGLDPGELYRIELGTKTGNVHTRQFIQDTLLTKPQSVEGMLVSNVNEDSCLVSWVHSEEGHSHLKGYQITVERFSDSKVLRVLVVKKSEKLFKIARLTPSLDYTLRIEVLCSHENLKTESSSNEAWLTTLPNPPKDLHIDSLPGTTSAILKWESPPNTIKHRLWIDCEEINYHFVTDIPGDRLQYNASKLPEITGTGRQYTAAIASVITSSRSNQDVTSSKATISFVTRPLPPTNIRISSNEKLTIFFDPSLTEKVSKYKIKWKGEEGAAMEELIESSDEGPLKFTFNFDFEINAVYKINIYALLIQEYEDDTTYESKELHEKLILKNESQIFSLYRAEEES
uniref:Protein tyrosine phosphatase, receptor type, J [Myotis lucifugus] n=1 Tax=Lepeophtheirus salmonis TaxID=72036 RepID=A0A0K2UDL8_LEPSM